MIKKKVKKAKETKATKIKQDFSEKKRAITVLCPGKFRFGVARIEDEKKIVVCAKFLSSFDAAKFCDLLNR